MTCTNAEFSSVNKTLGLRLGVPAYVPLVAPAVDLSVLGLLVGTRYLALHGARREQLRPAQRLLMFASGVTLGLNVAQPICAGQLGMKAAFDAVGPLLLIGWAEVGPSLLKAIREVDDHGQEQDAPDAGCDGAHNEETAPRTAVNNAAVQSDAGNNARAGAEEEDPLVADACRLDAKHWEKHQRPGVPPR